MLFLHLLRYFGHLMWRVDSLEKTLMLGGIGSRRRRGQQRVRWLDGITDQWTWVWVNSKSWWWTGRSGVLWFMGSQGVGHDWETELNWNELKIRLAGKNTYRASSMDHLNSRSIWIVIILKSFILNNFTYFNWYSETPKALEFHNHLNWKVCCKRLVKDEWYGRYLKF